ncbi:MAG: non-canonical purine NTP pyrophosphatase, partial [Nitrospirales bacterium]
MKEIVLATRNKDKGAELAALLSDMGIRIRTLAEFPDMGEVEEDGDTCSANAIKKAVAVAKHTGLIALADDTGLSVHALGGKPGVRAARFA